MSASDFRPIRPLTITDAMLTSSSVPEAVAATYAGGTTYAVGDRVGLAPVYGEAQLVYESLQAANLGNALPVPPATTTAWWKLVGTVYPVYASGSSCALGGIVSNIGTNVHELYESLVAANTGNPLTDATKWLLLGPTNRWKMFDQVAGTQTISPDTITVVLTPGALVTDAAFLNMSGASVAVTQSVSGYTKTTYLNSHPVLNWYDWWYESLRTADDVAFMGIPPYAASTLTITIAPSGGVAACGVCVIGRSRVIGQTQWGLNRGIKDFSRVTEDAYGGLVLIPGNYSKLMDLNIHVPLGFESEATHILTSLRALPVVFVASEDYDMAIIYGVLVDWRVPISNTGETARISIRGLI